MEPSLYYVSKRTGWWVQKMAIFDDVQYCVYADKVGWWSPKKAKNMLTLYRDGSYQTPFFAFFIDVNLNYFSKLFQFQNFSKLRHICFRCKGCWINTSYIKTFDLFTKCFHKTIITVWFKIKIREKNWRWAAHWNEITCLPNLYNLFSFFFRDENHGASDTDVGGRCCEVSGNDLDRVGRTSSGIEG